MAGRTDERFAFERLFPGQSIAAVGGGVVALARWPDGEHKPVELLNLYFGPDLERANRAAVSGAADAHELCVIWKAVGHPEARRQLAEAIGQKYKIEAVELAGN